MTIAAVLGCASATNKRRQNDFYETQGRHTVALCKAIKVPNAVWEPCAGTGAISKVLRQRHITVIESDLVVRRKGIREASFFDFSQPLVPAVVTNPPYRHAAKFIRHAEKIGIQFLAVLLKADFMNAGQRYDLVHSVGYPTHVFGLISRPDFTGERCPPMVCSWFVWRLWGATASKYILVDNRKWSTATRSRGRSRRIADSSG
jgi:hypothetical protein